ncbi:MAG: SspB family protein [Alphaproteobacteria bacterium]
MADQKIHRLDYGRMMDAALRNVVREALRVTERQGLIGGHHFYIAFRTRYPGVEMAPHLVIRHPEEMTIVLENQFWGLEVGEDHFEVTLSFNKIGERLHIPFASIVAFADPSARFKLQYVVDTSLELPLSLFEEPPGESDPGGEPTEKSIAAPPAGGDAGGKVIALDTFRKK